MKTIGVPRRRMVLLALASAIGLLGARDVEATPIVTYTLSLNDDGFGNSGGTFTPNSFAVYADVSADNGGLFGWGVDLTGPIDSIFTMGPGASYTKAGSQTKVAGFTTGVTEDIALAKVSGVTDLGAGANLIPIYGFGQVGGDLFASPPRPAGYTYHDLNKNFAGPAYNAHLLLAVGSYTGPPNGPGVPRFELGSVDNKASVYVNRTGTTSTIADLNLSTGPCFVLSGAVSSSGKLGSACSPIPPTFKLNGIVEHVNQAVGGSIAVTGSNHFYASEVDQLLDPSANVGSAPVQTIGDESGNLYVMAKVIGLASDVGIILQELNNASNDSEAAKLHALYDSQFGPGGFNLLYVTPNIAGAKVVNWDFSGNPGAVIDQIAVVPEPGMLGIAGVGAVLLSRRRK